VSEGTCGSKTSVESTSRGATERSVASSEACGVVTQPAVRVASGRAEPFEIGVKAMEGAEDLEVQALKDSPAYGA
jgi:hypothetical protein